MQNHCPLKGQERIKAVISTIGFGINLITDTEQLTSLLRGALSLGGYRHIDTAHLYGNEAQLGKAIRQVEAQGIVTRQEIVVSSKIFNRKSKTAQTEVKEMLQVMGLQYLDLLLMHWPVIDIEEDGSANYCPLQEFWSQLEECVTSGHVLHLGLSNFNAQLMHQVLTVCKMRPVCLQIQVHPYLPNHSLVEAAQREGLVVIAHTPLARGKDVSRGGTVKLDLLKEPLLEQVAQRHECRVAQVVLAWLRQRGLGCVPKSSKLTRIKENLESKAIVLTQQDKEKISSLDRGYRIVRGVTLYKYFNPFQ